MVTVIRMNFDSAETLREQLKTDCSSFKSLKAKSHQVKYTALVKEHEKRIEKLCEELESLKEEFKLFKLHTLSTIEQTDLEPLKRRCVSSPFTIYLQQK